jgi:nicotinamidase-related amidase
MSTPTYDPKSTAVLLVDPYNDFLSEGGKLFPRAKAIAEGVGLLENLRTIMRAAREAGLGIFFVPHRRSEPGQYDGWKYPTPYQLAGHESQIFAKDTWGGTFHDDFQPLPGDVIVVEHWRSSGFPNTDLDYQLRRHGYEKIVVIGMLANTCIEATGRIGVELGYHVTLVRDATAAYTPEAMHSAMNIDGPTYAHAILTTSELVAALKEGVNYDRCTSSRPGDQSAGERSRVVRVLQHLRGNR